MPSKTVPSQLSLSRPTFWFLVVTLALGLTLLLYGRWWTGAHLTYEQQKLPLRLLLVAYAGLVGGALGHLLGLARQRQLGRKHSGVVFSTTAGLFTFALCAASLIGLNTPSQAEQQFRQQHDWKLFQSELTLYLGAAELVQVVCPDRIFPLNERAMCYGSQQAELVFPSAAKQLKRLNGGIKWNWQNSPYSGDYHYGGGRLQIDNPRVLEGGDHFQMFYGYRDPERWINGKLQVGGPDVRSEGTEVAERESWLRWQPYSQYLFFVPTDLEPL